MSKPFLKFLFLLCVLVSNSLAQNSGNVKHFEAHDTVKFPADLTAEEKKMIDGFRYSPEEFAVACRVPNAQLDDGWNTNADAFVTFPSPRPLGFEAVDRVTMEWFAARDKKNLPMNAPAFLIVHELDGGMRVSRHLAQLLAQRGVHAFVLHQPGFGLRDAIDLPRTPEMFNKRGQQCIADIRRARDAMAALPHVDGNHISIQGTSMGGYVIVSAMAIDHAFENGFAFLIGGNIEQMLLHSRNESFIVWPLIRSEGVRRDDLGHGVLDGIEPMRLASRITPQKFWLISGNDDGLVGRESAVTLADALGLKGKFQNHHVWVTGNHFTALLHIEQIADFMIRPNDVKLP